MIAAAAVLRDLRAGRTVRRTWAPEAVAELVARDVVRVDARGYVHLALRPEPSGEAPRTRRERLLALAEWMIDGPARTASQIAREAAIPLWEAREIARRLAPTTPDRFGNAEEVARAIGALWRLPRGAK